MTVPTSETARDRSALVHAMDWAVAVAVGGAIVFGVRGRAAYVGWAFVPVIVLAFLATVSSAYRRRLRATVRVMAGDLGRFADGGAAPWGAAITMVVAPALLVFLSNNRVVAIADTCPVVPTAVTLLTEGNTNLDEFVRRDSWWLDPGLQTNGRPYFLESHANHLYSAYPSGMVSFALPVVAISKLMGGRIEEPIVQERLEKLTASAVAAVSLGIFFLIVLLLVPPIPALVTTWILAVSSGMFSTVGQNLWQHDGVIIGSLLVLLLEFRGTGRRSTLVQGLICGMMPAFRVIAVAFLVPMGIWVLLRSPRRGALMACGALFGYLPWMGYYWSVYGSPFGPSVGQMSGVLWSAEVLTPIAGVLVSPGRGLLVYQPWIVLALLLGFTAVRHGIHKGPRGWWMVCLGAVALQVGIVSAWRCWWGGSCWGSRLVIETVPFCALLCARPIAWLIASRRGRAVVFGLALLGILGQVPAVYLGSFRWNAVHVETLRADVWSWSDAPFLAPWTLPQGEMKVATSRRSSRRS